MHTGNPFSSIRKDLTTIPALLAVLDTDSRIWAKMCFQTDNSISYLCYMKIQHFIHHNVL